MAGVASAPAMLPPRASLSASSWAAAVPATAARAARDWHDAAARAASSSVGGVAGTAARCLRRAPRTTRGCSGPAGRRTNRSRARALELALDPGLRERGSQPARAGTPPGRAARRSGGRWGREPRARERRAPGCRAAPPRHPPRARTAPGERAGPARLRGPPSVPRARARGTGPSATTAAAPVGERARTNSDNAGITSSAGTRTVHSSAPRRGVTWVVKPARVSGGDASAGSTAVRTSTSPPATSATATGRSWVVRHSLVAWPKAGTAATRQSAIRAGINRMRLS